VIDLLVLVVSIAVVDSLNPATIAPALVLAGTPRPARGILGFAVGYFAVSVVGGLVALGFGHSVVDLVPRPRPGVLHGIELVLGLAALVAAGILWRGRHAIGARFARMEPRAHQLSPLAGGTLALIELPTALPFFAAIAALSASGEPLTIQIALVVLFQVLFLLPVLAIAIGCALARRRPGDRLTRIHQLVVRHAGSMVACLVLVAGIALVVLGVAGLAAPSH
jgi:cytochrome c biogenesis protein CcdA